MDFMPNLPKAQLTALRKTVIELVLATDMKQHFAIVTHFTATIGTNKADNPLCDKPLVTSPANTKQGCADVSNGAMEVSDADRLTVMQLALKCSDLGHTVTALPVHKR
jgi:cAMP-specific phosphodiesterase 4